MLTVPGLLIALAAPVALAIVGGVLSARFHRRAERRRTAARERRRAAYSARAERTIHDSFGRVRTAHFVSELLAEATPAGRTHPNNTHACGCDGTGQVWHGEGSLTYVTLCQDAACRERRQRAWG